MSNTGIPTAILTLRQLIGFRGWTRGGVESAGCGVGSGLELGPGEEGDAAVLGMGAGVCVCCDPIRLPQALQNFLPGSTADPHLGQRNESVATKAEGGATAPRAVPHVPQNFFPSLTSA